MIRSSPLLWIALILIALLPTAAGRLLLDIAGGLMLAALVIPILLTGAGWLGWRYLQSRMVQCEFCGTNIFTDAIQCPVCGSILSKDKQKKSASYNETLPASSATIDITPKDSK